LIQLPPATKRPAVKKKKGHFSLQTQVMLIFLALALAPLIAIGWFSITTTETLIIKAVTRQLENVAADKAAILERWLAERKADMMVVAGTAMVQSMDQNAMMPYLDLIRNKYEVYQNLTVIGADGAVVCISQNPPPPEKINEQENQNEKIVRDTLFMSDISCQPGELESTFQVAAPVFGMDGRLVGTVYGTVGTRKIIHFILNVFLGKTGECYLVDGDGRFLVHKEPARILRDNISQSESFRNIFEKRDRSRPYLDYRGIEVMGASLQIAGTDWHIVVEQDREEAFASAKILERVIYFTVMLCIASAFMITWIFSSHIIAPIRFLSKHAANIGDLAFDKRAGDVHRNDEIGILYRAFDEMSRKIQARQNHLQETVGQKEAALRQTGLMLQKTKQMAERSEKFAAMGRMGAAVAHEIRTPLTSLKLFLESVQDRIRDSEDDEEDFGIAMRQILRIEATINRFLDFARPRELVFLPIDMKKLMADVALMIRPMVNRNQCTLETNIADDLPLVRGDRMLLTEALVNLLVNALEAMSGQGTLGFSAKREGFTDDGRNGNRVSPSGVRIDISDTGAGIPKDQMDKIFEPFFTTKAAGTGLGLPLVINTVRDHGGVLRATSEPGQGTTFSVFLPEAEDEGENGKNSAH
jgi:signal transduction histidine kinase